MFSVVHASLLWGLALLSVPILIHLINRLRHRRIGWAAMEFLLASQKRSRTWIMLKQLLLLLLRIGAVAAIVLMLAQPRIQWAALLGTAKTHHIVLVDDSYSMSDRSSDSSAFERAKQFVLRLADQAARANNPQMFTVLRFSQADTGPRGTQPDLLQQPLTDSLREQLGSIVGGWTASQLAVGPVEALEAVERLPQQGDSEERMVYLISDFRTNQWDAPAAARTALTRLEHGGAHLQLVDCVDSTHVNLAITDLRATGGVCTAGVPLWMEVTVTNYATSLARDVSVTLAEDGLARPAVVIEKIPAGKSVTRRFPVVFVAAGQHQVSAALESDAVAADNVRYAVMEVAVTAPVLIVDGDPRASDAFFLSTALSPGGKVKSGISPLIESPRFLRDHALDGYEAIMLLNFERLDTTEIAALEAYVRAGGGLGIFLGELNRADFINKYLYRDGEGLFPLPLVGVTELLVDRAEQVPDLEVTDHPIFSVFAGQRNSFIGTVMVERYFAAQKNWKPAEDSATEVIARLRNGAPLAVESRLGEGRVVAFLTKAGPEETPQGAWNNWGRNNPSYVVAMLELEAYLAEGRHRIVAHLVGAPLTTSMPRVQYEPTVRFVLPRQQGGGTLSVDAVAEGSELTAVLSDTAVAGIYEAQWAQHNAGEVVTTQFALNVDPREGDLRRLDATQLAERLRGVKYLYQQAQDVIYDGERLAGPNLGRFFMWLLVAVLLVEQVLAYSASYHPARRGSSTLMFCTLLAEATTSRTTYDFERWQSFSERWHVLALLAVCAAVLVFVVSLYRRDSVELRRGWGWVLLTLRVMALIGILAYFLELEKRTERAAVRNSRVLVLVDTSLSMGLRDTTGARDVQPAANAAEEGPATVSMSAAPNRLEQVVAVLDHDGFIRRLRELHDVLLVRFDAEMSRLATLPKLGSPTAEQTAATASDAAVPDATAPVDASATSDAGSTSAGDPVKNNETDWKAALRPQGSETRLGQALRDVIREEHAAPLAGIVVFSDGGQNAGIDAQSAILTARDAKVPVYTVGVGSDRRPAGVRVADFVAPTRAYPGDSFVVTAYLQAQELAGRTVTVELTSKPAGDASGNAARKAEGTEQVLLGGNTEIVPVKFTLTPADTGRRTFRLEVKPPAEDRDTADNAQELDIEIVDRKTKVLLVASGPTREYIFLRNQLRRDSEMIVDVYLQSGQKGISQDANEIITPFPTEAQVLFQYDAIVAFDPDWLALDENQIELLERWVAEKAGGLIVVAGPVEMDRWVSESRMAKIRGLYPVEFSRRLTLMEEGRFGSETVWPLAFTREGLEAEFLWLADNASTSQQNWASFPGVYGYYGVHGAKPGATVFARYSDPEAASGGQLPVYLAGHFYGSGRVFYLGSGEMWRLRAINESFFEQFYTKLIRHVSQGRLLIGSSRGMLLVDRDRYLLGGTILVRAQLSDSQFEPLAATHVPLSIIQPDGTLETLQLVADQARKGMFAGQFSALKEGTYRLDLPLPGDGEETLTRRIQVKVPELERERPERNDALLSDIAHSTGGSYYVGAESVLGKAGLPELAAQLPDRTETTYLSGVKDLDFEGRWMWTLLGVIAGALFLEWTLRRLVKLA